MRGYRNKILMGITVLVVLVVAFLFDSGSDVVQKTSTAVTQENIEKPTNEPVAIPGQEGEIAEAPKQSEEPVVSEKPEAAHEAVTSSIQPEVTDELTCTVSIRCNTILDNLSKLDSDKVKIIPADGVILAEQTVTFEEGENVFDVLMRVTKDHKIHMEYMSTPIYKSAYIEGIANIYEFDCGELSGWQYKVNGVFPSYGCSRYTLVPGDKIEWVYTCDLGKDVGGYQDLSEE